MLLKARFPNGVVLTQCFPVFEGEGILCRNLSLPILLPLSFLRLSSSLPLSSRASLPIQEFFKKEGKRGKARDRGNYPLHCFTEAEGAKYWQSSLLLYSIVLPRKPQDEVRFISVCGVHTEFRS